MSNYRYTLEFKKQVVQDIESGKYKTAEEARRTLDIGGKMTVLKWVANYGKNVKLADTDKVTSILDIRMKQNSKEDKIRILEKQLEEMREAKSNKDIELEFYKAAFEVVKEDYGIDLKKKFGSEQRKK